MRGPATGAALLCLCAAATSPVRAQDSSSGAANGYLNSQVQLGDVIAGQQLQVQEATGGATGVATAVGNSASAGGANADLGFQSTQTLGGQVSATSTTGVAVSSGPYLVTSTSATGNSTTASTCCGTVSGSSTQTITGQGVGATNTTQLNGYATQTEADSSAVGNTQGWNSYQGAVNASASQSSAGGVTAVNVAGVHATNTGVFTTTAVANDVEVNGQTSPVTMDVQQSQSGVTQAIGQTTQDYAGDSAATTSAVANNFNVYSDSYGNFVTADQSNSGAVNVSNNQTVGTWYGTVATTGYGVGNSTLVSNAGSYTQMDTTQNNSGAVTVNASLYGGGIGDGGGAFVSATGVGNAVSGYACASCNGIISAHNKQTNSASVHAGANLTAQNVTTATGAASAVGNTADYQVVSSGSD